MTRPSLILILLFYYLINDVCADLFIGHDPSLWWIAAIVFAITTICYAALYLYRYRVPKRPIKPWMKKGWWVAIELLTAIATVALAGWSCWFFGYNTIHFGHLLIEILLLLPTGLHIEALGAHRTTDKNPMNDEAST